MWNRVHSYWNRIQYTWHRVQYVPMRTKASWSTKAAQSDNTSSSFSKGTVSRCLVSAKESGQLQTGAGSVSPSRITPWLLYSPLLGIETFLWIFVDHPLDWMALANCATLRTKWEFWREKMISPSPPLSFFCVKLWKYPPTFSHNHIYNQNVTKDQGQTPFYSCAS